MSSIPDELQYTQDHEWLRREPEGQATIGITDYAQEQLGDVTYVELPEVGARYEAGETFGVVESVKAASDLYMPQTGTVLEVNATLNEAPEQLNSDPYAAGWVLKIQPEDAGADGLLSPEDYRALVG